MALDQKFFKKSTAAGSGLTDQEQGLVLHLDANDVDSYDGDGSAWYDITKHEVNIPLADKASNLQLHLNASDTTSYDGSGTTWTDISGNSRNATINGGVESTYTTGLKGSFDLVQNTGDYFEVTHHNDISPSSSGITFEAWVTPDNTSNTNNIFWIGNSGGYGEFSAGTNNSTAFVTTMTSSAYVNQIATGNVITAGQLHHIVFTMSHVTNPVVNIYVDGTFQVTNTGSGTVIDTNENLKIGRYTGGNPNDFDGKIHAVRVYNTVLTSAEVGQNFRAGINFSYSSIITSKHEATQGTLYTSNLAFHLDANGHSGTDWTDSVGSINGTINGATYVNDNNSDYFTFDGSDDTVTFPATDTSPINFSSETHTIEFWVNFNNLTTDDVVLGKFGGSNATKSFQIAVSNSNKLTVLERDGGSNNFFETTGTFSTGVWTHFTYTRSASQVKLYINGVIDSDPAANNSINAGSTQNITIGNQSGSFFFDGKLAQLRIYSSTLDSSQVNTNYNATKTLYQNPDILTDLRPSNYSSGTTWNDSSTKSNNATLNNFGSTVADYYDEEIGNFFDLESNDYFSTSITKNWASIPFSVEMWFNTDSRNGEYLWGLNENSSQAYGVGPSVRGSGNGYQLMFLGSGLIVSAGVVETNRWYHLVFTSDGTTKKAYLDGQLKGSGTTTINSAANGKPFIFGRYGTYPGAYFNGKIGHTRVYEGALTAEQVAQNYLATKNNYPNGNNATISGSPTWGTYNSGGVTYNYFDLNGSSHYMTIPQNTIFDFELPTTLEVWVNKDGTGREWVIQKSNGGSGSYSWQLEHSSSGNYRFQMHNTSNGTITINVTSATNTGTWYHIAITHDGNNVYKIYLNGSLQESATLSGTISKNTNGVTIGKYIVGGYEFDGKIGMIKFYNKTFSATEVTAAYNNTKGTYGIT